MDTSKISFSLWQEIEREKDKQIAYAYSDRDKKHIITQTYGKILAELWKTTSPKLTPVRIKTILTEYPTLKDVPPDLAVLLYYSVKATDFLWGTIKVDFPKVDTKEVLDLIPGYKKTKEEFEKTYGNNK